MKLDIVFSYFWHIDDKEEHTAIRLYGLGNNNENICLRIDDFQPYVYIELPDTIKWDASSTQKVASKIDDLIEGDEDWKKKYNERKKPLTKSYQLKYRLYGAYLKDDKTRKKFPYLKLTFSNVKHIKNLMWIIGKPIRVLGIGDIKLKMHEQDASPILQLVSNLNIPTAGWIVFKGNLVPTESKLTLCDKEYKVSWKNISPFKPEMNLKIPCKRAHDGLVADPLLMAFDLEVNSTNPSAMPNAKKAGDKIFQISCIFSRDSGIENTYTRYLLSLGDPEPIDDVIIRAFRNESDLILGFTTLVREMNPNVIIGYNIFGFDIPYMIDRAKDPCMCLSEFDKFGFHKETHAKELVIKWSSSAFKDQEFAFLDGEGRLFIDLLPLVKRDYKFNSYKLDAVSKEILKDSKKDLSPAGIFKCYRIGIEKDKVGVYTKKARKAMSIVGRYCIQDSVLLLKLMSKMKLWIGLTEQATTFNTSIFSIYTAGQQIKVYSQLYTYCLKNNIVVEKDGYVASENESYTGAHVFDPEVGMHDNVVCLDFCVTGDTLITLSNGYSRRIDSLITDTPLYGCNEDKGFEVVSSINGLQRKGIRDIISVYLTDGRIIKATPEHKFMLEDGSWCEAQNLEGKYVRCGIEYPIDEICTLETDWKLETKGYTFTMNSAEEREKTLIFVGILGFTLADGCIYKNKDRIQSEAYLGSIIDAEQLKADILFLVNKKVNIRKRVSKEGSKGITFCISYPTILCDMISSLEDIIVGKRATQAMKLPKFLSDNKCPLSVIKRFLGGIFGGDGSAPVLSKEKINSIRLKWTTIETYFPNMKLVFEQFGYMFKRLGVETSFSKPIKVKYGINSLKPKDYLENPRWDFQINIKLDNTQLYAKNIGFLYCINKSYRLTLSTSYFRMSDFARRQYEIIVNRTNELFNNPSNKLTTKECLDIATKELKEKEPVLFDVSLSSPEDVRYQRGHKIRYPNRPRKFSLSKKKFWSFKDYNKEINTFEWWGVSNRSSYSVKSDDEFIPFYRSKVEAIKKANSEEVFDIEVKNLHNFIANGVVISNCSLYPNSIIAYNIDYSTFVQDETIPDSDCNIMQWGDHISCDHDPKVIRKKELTTFIDIQKDIQKKLRERRDKTKDAILKQGYKNELEENIKFLKPYIEERANISIAKKAICAERKYRFLKEPAGVLPTILKDMLDARKNTRKQIKKVKCSNEVCKEPATHGITEAKFCVLHKGDNQTEFISDKSRIADLRVLLDVLDKRQLAYKVSCNSAYGAMGVKRGYIPFMPGAMVVCAIGRKNITYVADVIQHKYGGNLVYGDTDSTLLTFPAFKTPQALWDQAIYVADEISKLFPPPMKLEFENAIYQKYLIFSKKRYMFSITDRDGNVQMNKDQIKIGRKGILLARRDNALFIRNLFQAIANLIFTNVSSKDVLYFITTELNRMFSRSVPVQEFVITQAVGNVNNMQIEYKTENKVLKAFIGSYKTKALPTDAKLREKALEDKEVSNELDYYEKCLPAVVQLAQKMRRRGQRVDMGSRLEYVIIDNGINKDKKYNKIESVDYLINHSDVIKIDFLWYLKAMIEPLDQLLNTWLNIPLNFFAKQYKYRENYIKVRVELISNLSPKLIFKE